MQCVVHCEVTSSHVRGGYGARYSFHEQSVRVGRDDTNLELPKVLLRWNQFASVLLDVCRFYNGSFLVNY